jgi:hypothetical protein
MKAVRTTCPACGRSLELSLDLQNVICLACGNIFLIREHEGSISLLRDSRETRLHELDEEINQTAGEIDELRSKEKGVPLQLGCGILGVFFTVVVVLAVFVTVARSYFAGFWFFLALSLVIIFGAWRLRGRLPGNTFREGLRRERADLEANLASLEFERLRLSADSDPRPRRD